MNTRPDPTLAAELQSPGTDARLGASLVLRPPPALRRAVGVLQARLRALDPGLYLYPEADLHLTLLELGSGLGAAEARALAEGALAVLPGALEGLGGLTLGGAVARWDADAGFLRFLEADGLLALRRTLLERLRAAGVEARPRYLNEVAHMSFLRFLGPLSADAAAFEACFGPLPPLPPWRVGSAWLCWGATWYGRRSRLEERGPFTLR